MYKCRSVIFLKLMIKILYQHFVKKKMEIKLNYKEYIEEKGLYEYSKLRWIIHNQR